MPKSPYYCTVEEFYITTEWEKSNTSMSNDDILHSCKLNIIDRFIVEKDSWFSLSKKLYYELGAVLFGILLYFGFIISAEWYMTTFLTITWLWIAGLISFVYIKIRKIMLSIVFISCPILWLLWSWLPPNFLYMTIDFPTTYPPFIVNWYNFFPYYILYLGFECVMYYAHRRYITLNPIPISVQVDLQQQSNWYFLSNEWSTRNIGYFICYIFFRALIEEILFRWVLLNLITIWITNLIIAIILLSLVFGIFHIPDGTSGFIYGIFGGLMMTFFYINWGIWASTLVHMTWNFFVVFGEMNEKFNLGV